MSTVNQVSAITKELDVLEVIDLDSETLVEVFAQRGWGDGLPLVAPTTQRVELMLEGYDGDPDELLGAIPPRHGILTPRVVAVNAVLAGCEPKVMPVLVAVARILGGAGLNLAGVNPTT